MMISQQEYEALVAELNEAQADAIALIPRLVAGEKITQAELGAKSLRLDAAGRALYEAVQATFKPPSGWMA